MSFWGCGGMTQILLPIPIDLECLSIESGSNKKNGLIAASNTFPQNVFIRRQTGTKSYATMLA